MTIEEAWKNLFDFRPGRFVIDATEGIKAEIVRRDHKGVVFGASGGIDSLVSAALCIRAREGKRAWRVVGLQMIDSRVKGEFYNPGTFRELGVELIVQDITGEAVQTEKRLGMPPRWLTLLLMKAVLSFLPGPVVRRLILAIKTEAVPRQVLGHFQLLIHLHRLRISRLREFADRRHLMPVICANLTEISLGYFVEGGIDDPAMGEYAPISGLYKSQVIATARYLGIPEKAIAQKPSPGFGGIHDEEIIGPYEIIDPVLAGIAAGFSDSEIANALRRSSFPVKHGRLRWKGRRCPIQYIRFLRNLMESSAQKKRAVKRDSCKKRRL